MSEINFSYEDLPKLNELELKKHILAVRAQINHKRKLNEDTKKLEIYICYAIRELESRMAFV